MKGTPSTSTVVSGALADRERRELRLADLSICCAARFAATGPLAVVPGEREARADAHDHPADQDAEDRQADDQLDQAEAAGARRRPGVEAAGRPRPMTVRSDERCRIRRPRGSWCHPASGPVRNRVSPTTRSWTFPDRILESRRPSAGSSAPPRPRRRRAGRRSCRRRGRSRSRSRRRRCPAVVRPAANRPGTGAPVGVEHPTVDVGGEPAERERRVDRLAVDAQVDRAERRAQRHEPLRRLVPLGVLAALGVAVVARRRCGASAASGRPRSRASSSAVSAAHCSRMPTKLTSKISSLTTMYTSPSCSSSARMPMRPV